MKILIATGVYPPDIGGPAEYAKNLEEEFIRLGHKVTVLSYQKEKGMPVGIRHLYYFFRVVRQISAMDFVLALDTMSVGLPAVCAAKLFFKKSAVRIGGDFLWESYVERTGHLIPWAQFYGSHKMFSVKERIIFSLTRFTLRLADALAFNSEWQLRGMVPVYGLDVGKTSVILNFFGEPLPASAPSEKNFIWATRSIKLKNGQNLKKAFDEAVKIDGGLKLDSRQSTHEELLNKIASCYAVILPSVSEMSPNFILDALRFGKPFILTRETGLYDIVKDAGLFVDPLRPEDITEKILTLADDEKYSAYQKKAASFHLKHSWADIAGEFLGLYRGI